ncbi:MAG: hypothetical protein N3A02_08670, partial [Rectinema sp.]|nr:hypothetical protein [Rectinema sp.]
MDERARRACQRCGSMALLLIAILALFMGCRPSGMLISLPLRSGRIAIWENIEEGFSLVLAEQKDQARGFLAWGRRGIYGRIGTATRKSGTLELTLADGGMNGIRLKARMAHGSLVFEGEGAARMVAAPRQHRLKLAGGIFPQPSGKKDESRLSMRLQYVSSSDRKEALLLNTVLRRSLDPERHAAERLKQQLEAAAADQQQNQHSSSRPPFVRVYEEIEYPVFVSDRYLCVAVSRYLFEGGAHGFAATDIDVIDRVAATRVEIGDLLGQDHDEALERLLEKALIHQFNTIDRMPRRPETDLRSYGLFEPKLPVPKDIFPCYAGCLLYTSDAA